MQPEALVYAGYTFARHNHRPSNSWQKSYLRSLQGVAKTLAGEEFPLALFTLARWRQQQQQQQQQGVAGSQQQQQQQFDQDGYREEPDEYDDSADQWANGSSCSAAEGTGTAAPQSLIDELLFASHSNRALRELPLSQLVVMVKSLAELQASVSPMWMQRLWPLINSKIDAAVAADTSSSSSSSRSSSGRSTSAGSLAGDLAALLAVIPRLQPAPQLPADFLEGLVGNLGLGLEQLRSRDLAAAWAALQQLDHQPDAIFQRQLQAALLAAVPKAASSELPVLLQLGLAVGASSSSGSVQGLLSSEAFYEQLLQAFVEEVSRRADVAAGNGTASGAATAKSAQQRQQLLAGAAADGLWQLPQTLATCVQHLSSSSSSEVSPAAAAVLQRYLPQLQQLYSSSAAALAAVMPADPLMVLLGFMLDMPEDQEQQLGLNSSSSSKQAAVSAVLQAGVYQHLASTVPAAPKGGVTSVTSSARKNLLLSFSVIDFLELLVVISDARLQQQMPREVLDAAAEALHGALAPKGPAYGFDCAPQDAADLVREMFTGYGYSLPAKVKSRYKKSAGDAVPEELTMRVKRASSSSSSSSSKALAGGKKAAAAVQQPAATAVAVPASVVQAAAPSAAAAAAAPPPAAPVVDAGGVVRSSRSRASG
jgi:hypothetical protein